MAENISPSRSVDAILAKVRESYSFEAEEVKAYQENPKVYPALIERMRAMEDAAQEKCLDRFGDLGAAVVISQEYGGLFLAPYISDPVIIQGLVEFLGDENDDVRDAAVRQIFESVPDIYLRNHGKEVVEKVIAHPNASRAAQVLAKAGSERALSVIRSNRTVRDQDELWTAQALAKLGDSVKEDFLIEKYRLEKQDAAKRDYAWMLGFVATPKTILALARDLRNPMTYEWNQTAPRSFRVHIIEGLSRAYPMEPLLWKPNGTPRDDAYYQRIEDWAESKLGVTWSVPRPPFLYEMEVPVPASNP